VSWQRSKHILEVGKVYFLVLFVGGCFFAMRLKYCKLFVML
jgi:hypothetical protein